MPQHTNERQIYKDSSYYMSREIYVEDIQEVLQRI